MLMSKYKEYTFIKISDFVLRVIHEDGYFRDISVGEEYETKRYKVRVRIVALQDEYHERDRSYYFKSSPIDPNVKEGRGEDITAKHIFETLLDRGELKKLSQVEFEMMKNSTLKIVESQKTVRTAQNEFREHGLERYQRCVLSGIALPSALEAAHIQPVNGYNDNVDNCLILRRDLHHLFDQYMWSIDDKTLSVALSSQMQKEPQYAQYHGQALLITDSVRESMIEKSRDYLNEHFKEFKKVCRNAQKSKAKIKE